MSGADVVLLRAQLLQLTERLIRENRDSVAAGAVIRAVASARDELRAAGLRNGLLPAVEALARERLQRQPTRV
jgi:hypothetical protein